MQNLDQLYQHLEKTAEDELTLLVETGPQFFTTAQLLRLRGQWEVKNKLYKDISALLLKTAAISPVWLLAWFGFGSLGLNWLGLFCLFLFPTSFLIFFSGLLLLRYYFSDKSHLDQVGELITLELEKRQEKPKR